MPEEPSQEFRDLLDEITDPTPAPADVLRAVSLLPDPPSRELEHAARAAGIEIVHRHTVGDLPDFTQIPTYDVVLTALPDDRQERPASVDFMLRFIRGRRPLAFVALGQGTANSINLIDGAMEPFGYRVEGVGLDACVGTRKDVPVQKFSAEELSVFPVGLSLLDRETWATVRRVALTMRMAQLEMR